MDTKKLSRDILQYAGDFVGRLLEGEIGPPSMGDCMTCALRTADKNIPLGEATNDTDHLLSHMEEPYYVPSLLFRATEVFPVSQAAMMVLGDLWHDRDGKAVDVFGEVARKQLKWSLRRYMRRQFGLKR